MAEDPDLSREDQSLIGTRGTANTSWPDDEKAGLNDEEYLASRGEDGKLKKVSKKQVVERSPPFRRVNFIDIWSKA